ncbi:MFS transporter [Spongiactinospora sp. TRM90649]|uniref:MFS transporter n=1 Tax=Spongiactinospora sp. TRM90649 TaxID=3031114 RepID=UPI0023F7BF6C|nr:MFS transporter [Spongiactinospora sp. TRM90649]MDF5753413.1 MFS transporter [Spongiactinospora sp. TRM90649]
MTRELRTARFGAIVTFVLAGLLCGSFTVRIPALADRLGLTEGAVGAVLLAWGVGALVTMQAMRSVMARAGSRAVLRAAGPLCAATLVGVAFAPDLPALLAAAAAFGMAFGTLDIAMNAQGSVVERAAGRHLMNGMHAGWCVGAISAGLLGTLAIGTGLPYGAHLALMAALTLPPLLIVGRAYLAEPRRARKDPSRDGRRRVPPVVYLLGVIAFCAFMVEGTVADWNGLYLRDSLGAPEALAALGYPLFEAGMLAGRLAGDRLRARLGAPALLTASGLATAATFTLVISAPTAALALTGMAFVGVAVATISPVALSLAGTATTSPGPAIAQTGAMGYAGLLLGPVVIGFLSGHASLRTALFTAVALGVVIAVAARLLPRVRARQAATATGAQHDDAAGSRPEAVREPAAA